LAKLDDQLNVYQSLTAQKSKLIETNYAAKYRRKAAKSLFKKDAPSSMEETGKKTINSFLRQLQCSPKERPHAY